MERWVKVVQMVKDFYIAFGQEEHIKRKGIIDFTRSVLRVKLLTEELDEYFEAKQNQDRAAMLDAVCDMSYIHIGTMLEKAGGDTDSVAKKIYFNNDPVFDTIHRRIRENKFGDIFMDAFEEVHKSNMSKLQNGKPIFREDGKILKGPDYLPPNLEQFLIRGGRK